MAVDTAKKRKSVAAIGLIMVGPVVVPDSSIDAGDRYTIGYSYSGITINATPTAGFVSIGSIQLITPRAIVTLQS